MSRRSLRRRAALWLAGTILIGMTTLTSGCRWVPVRRVDPALDPRVAGPVNSPRPDRDEREIETVTLDGPMGLPPLPDDDPRGQIARTPVRAPATPMLDEALRRARALEEAVSQTAPSDFPVLNPTPIIEPSPNPAFDEPAPLILPPGPEAQAPIPVSSPIDHQVHAALLETVGTDVTAELPVAAAESPQPDADTWIGVLQSLRELANDEARHEDADDDIWRLRAEILDRMIARGSTGDEDIDESLESVMALLAAPARIDPAVTRAGLDADEADEIPTEPEAPSGLAIADLQLCRQVHGFGHYEKESGEAFHAGQIVILYSEVERVTYVPRGDEFHSRLGSRVELRPVAGGEAVWSRDLPTAEDLCRRPRRDYYVNYQFALPTVDRVPAGSYRLELTQTDALSGATASSSVPLSITAK